MQEVSRTKNQQATTSMNKIIFKRKRINVSQKNEFHKEENQHARSFENRNQHATCSLNMIDTQQVPETNRIL